MKQRITRFLTRVLFPLVLLFWPFVNVAQGVDIADGAYSLTNYAYSGAMDPMWKLATWIPNVMGSFFTCLPGGGTMMGMNIWCSLIIAATAEIAYFGLLRYLHEIDPALSRWAQEILIFVGVWIAESLCWCPSTILYNYLTYFFLTLAGVFLLRGFSGRAGAGRYYVLAGLCLGLNLFVRFPNAVEVLLILAVWFREAIAGSDGQKVFPRILRATGSCLCGYITGAIIPIVIILIRYGPSSYFNMIVGLFSMTGSAQDYTPGGMLLSILGAYATTLKELLLTVPVLLTGFALFYLVTAGKIGEEREDGAKELGWQKHRRMRILAVIAYAVLVLLLFRLYFSFGVFTRSYQYYDSFFEAGMMAVVLSLVLSAVGMTPALYRDLPLRAGCLLVLLVILITPIGSNNYTYPVLNNFFLVLPFLLLALRAVWTRKPVSSDGLRPLIAGGIRTPLVVWAAGLILLLSVQGAIFHVRFAFGDGTDGTKRDALIREIPRARGMHTTRMSADSLTELYRQLHGAYADAVRAADGRAIILGDAPGLHYLMELEPALFTAWPDLASNETERFDEALLNIAASGDRPLVILHTDTARYPDTAGFSAPEKADLLLDYLAETGYNKLFGVAISDGRQYTVYAIP